MQNKKQLLSAFFLILLISILLSVIYTEEISWSNEFQLTTDPGTDRNPCATHFLQAASETIWVVWSSNRTGNYEIFYKNSSDGAAIDMQLTDHPDKDDSPSIMQTADGSIWVVWTRDAITPEFNRDLYYKNSSDGGATWSVDTRFTTDPDDDLSASIIQTANGTIWVVWCSDRISVNDPGGGGPKPQDDLFYATSSDSGATWSNDRRLTNHTNDDMDPSITQTTDDKIWVTWVSGRNDSRDIFYKTTSDGGATWSDDFQLTGHTGDEWGPSITQNNGTIWIVWYSAKTGNCEIYYATSDDDGANWSNERRITVDTGVDVAPSIAQIAGGEIWIFWASNRAGNYDIWYKTTIQDGSPWGADMDHDGDVDREDVVLFAGSYGCSFGEKGYSPDADYDNDGDVDSHDVTSFLICYYGART